MPVERNSRPATARVVLVILLVGLALGAVMVARSQTGGDQGNLLLVGWLLYDEGRWLPYGNHVSGGGVYPGGLVALLVALPLFAVEHFRSVNAFVLLTHVLGYFLLDRVMRDALSSRERALFAVLYWLNPWRAYFSAYVWNPNFMFVIGAAHCWISYRQRDRGGFWASFLHVLILGAAHQLHGSFLILVVASVLLWFRGYIRVHWGGAIVGATVVLGSLVPWALAAIENPDILPMQEGFPGRGLILLFPLLKGAMYWMRYASLHFSNDVIRFDFTPLLGSGADSVLTPLFRGFAIAVGPLTVLVPLLANAWLWRRGPGTARGRRWKRIRSGARPREWVAGYARWVFLAAVFSFALSPTTIMMWQALIVMHAAVLPVVLWAGVLLRSRRGPTYRRIAIAWAVAYTVMLAVMSVASPLYRQGGRDARVLYQHRSTPLIERTGILEECTVEFDPNRPLPDMFRRLEWGTVEEPEDD